MWHPFPRTEQHNMPTARQRKNRNVEKDLLCIKIDLLQGFHYSVVTVKAVVGGDPLDQRKVSAWVIGFL